MLIDHLCRNVLQQKPFAQSILPLTLRWKQKEICPNCLIFSLATHSTFCNNTYQPPNSLRIKSFTCLWSVSITMATVFHRLAHHHTLVTKTVTEHHGTPLPPLCVAEMNEWVNFYTFPWSLPIMLYSSFNSTLSFHRVFLSKKLKSINHRLSWAF